MEYTTPFGTEWYDNSPRGLEQGFIFTARPSGSGPLAIRYALTLSNLDPSLASDGRSVVFADNRATPRLRYSDLVAADADGKQLRASLLLGHGTLVLEVDDSAARYPIVVDPLTTSADWSYSHSGDCDLGWMVAGIGDVNGDGYSDVCVGSPNDECPTNASDLYVFYGSATGLTTSPSWSLAGAAGSGLGYAGGPAGDVNGDGYSDIIVGAPFADSASYVACGRASVYLGSSTGLSTAAAWDKFGDQSGCLFGICTGYAGDVNADAKDDILIGASYYDSGTSQDIGRVWLYLGSSSGPSSSPWWSRYGDQTAAQFGFTAATAGDVNADGYADVLLGAHSYQHAYAYEGKVQLFLGGPDSLSATGWIRYGYQEGASYGRWAITAGDVNADGYADVIIGAPGYSNGQTGEGRAYVYHGNSSSLDTTAAWTAESNEAGASFGYSVAPAGDVNGDGFADVIVGALYYSGGVSQRGAAYAYTGSATGLSAAASWFTVGPNASDFYGVSVAGAGDVNGDGCGDVIVGACGPPPPPTTTVGHAYAYYGSADGLAASNSWVVQGDLANANLGFSVASAGDVNNDGYSDVIVGAPYFTNGQTNEGKVFVYCGSRTGLATTPAWTYESNQGQAWLGSSVSGAGDVDGGGPSDVIIGAPGWTDGAKTHCGSALLFLGHTGTGLDTSPASQVFGAQYDERLGESVAWAGDVNRDGLSDVIVGAPRYGSGNFQEGRALIYLGSAGGLDTTSAWTTEANQDTAWYGACVSTAGDVDRDGYSDVLVGAPYWNESSYYDAGKVYLYRGGSQGVSTSSAWTLTVSQVGARLGTSASTAGDVNGDGYSDVIVGAPLYSNTLSAQGRATVYHGQSSSPYLGSVAWTTYGEQSDEYHGWSVGFAGDVNADGYSDVIIGQPRYDTGDSLNAGRVAVYQGSSSGLSTTEAWNFAGGLGNGKFGFDVGTAGDINGDGFSDIIIGYPDKTNPEVAEGYAVVYDGGGGRGPARLPKQARKNSATSRLDVLGSSDDYTSVRLGMLGRTPAGRGKVRLEWEVKNRTTAFSATGYSKGQLHWTGAPTDSGSIVPLDTLVTGLSGQTDYKWRIRLASQSPYFPRSPWLSIPYNGITEKDFLTPARDQILPDPLVSTKGQNLLQLSIRPMPVLAEATIDYSLPEAEQAQIRIFDLQGRLVKTLFDGLQGAGPWSIVWDGRRSDGKRVAAGLYFVRLTTGTQQLIRSTILMR